jgi:hypothetical protein
LSFSGYSRLFQAITVYSRLFQAITVYSRLFQAIQGFSRILQAISPISVDSVYSAQLHFIYTGCGSASLKLCMRKAASPWSPRPSGNSQCPILGVRNEYLEKAGL